MAQFAPTTHQTTPSDLPPRVKSNPLYAPDPQDGAEVWRNPQHNRLTQSEEHVAPNAYRDDPNAHGPQPDVSILLQGGSLPHVAHTDPITETPAGLGVCTCYIYTCTLLTDVSSPVSPSFHAIILCMAFDLSYARKKGEPGEKATDRLQCH